MKKARWREILKFQYISLPKHIIELNIMRTQKLTNLLSTFTISLLLSACAPTAEEASTTDSTSPTTEDSLITDDTSVTPDDTANDSSNDSPDNIPTNADTSITEGMVWSYFKGTESPGSDWNTLSYDDSNWLTGASGFGYGDNDDTTVLSDMSGNYRTLYTRKTFSITARQQLQS